MKKNLLIILAFVMIASTSFAEIFPLSLQSRVDECEYLVIGQVTNTISYWDKDHENIYTLHEIKIDGYLKGQNSATYIGLIDLGGQVGIHMQETFPSVSLSVGDYGVFMLGADAPSKLKSTSFENQSANFIQALPTASIQGAILRKGNLWLDPSDPNAVLTTAAFLQQLEAIAGNSFSDARGKSVKIVTPVVGKTQQQSSNKTLAVTTLQNGSLATTSTFNSGVSDNASMEMIINGSGFGTTAGTIEFPNADAGGGTNTFVFPTTTAASQSRFGAPSDIISWTNSQIRVRVPRNAGTGTMEVFNSSNVSQGTANITIDWAIIPIYSDFLNFTTRTSQFGKLMEDNSPGGYLFEMSTGGSANFFTNAAAKDAFRRALNTWRCGTSMNFELDLASGTSVGFANDGTNVVMFDNSLSSGVLGRCTSRFTASGSSSCDLHDTYWRAEEIDVQFQVIPFTGFTWNYNSTGTSSSQFSFETVALHEVGHGHGMGHVIDVSKVMYYSSSNGTQNTTLATSDISAGNYKIANSTGTNCITTPSPMTALINPCIPLPIDLLSFRAYVKEANNEILWETANESGIAKYILESSVDGTVFADLGDVMAKGDDDNMYTYLHENPQSNLNYYRLRILDKDGQSTYSQVVSILRNDKGFYTLSPNPTTGKLNINISGLPLQTNRVAYTITDLNGRNLLSKDIVVNAKNAQFSESLKSLPAGMYFVQLSINGKTETQKIVKQ